MPSFDTVSEVDMQEVRNAVDQAARELVTRFDFRGIDAGFELEGEAIKLHAQEEFQLDQMLDILKDKLIKRGVDVRALDPGKVEASGKQKRQSFALKQGIDRDAAKLIVGLIKDAKLKVDCAHAQVGSGQDPARLYQLPRLAQGDSVITSR
jgi:uncharacterized protein YajQ (UPF0234 family)